tara:strand:+ start:480 stop:704 length:225 start_codon:yes stop_codon:yes gene_type:complete
MTRPRPFNSDVAPVLKPTVPKAENDSNAKSRTSIWLLVKARNKVHKKTKAKQMSVTAYDLRTVDGAISLPKAVT